MMFPSSSAVMARKYLFLRMYLKVRPTNFSEHQMPQRSFFWVRALQKCAYLFRLFRLMSRSSSSTKDRKLRVWHIPKLFYPPEICSDLKTPNWTHLCVRLQNKLQLRNSCLWAVRQFKKNQCDWTQTCTKTNVHKTGQNHKKCVKCASFARQHLLFFRIHPILKHVQFLNHSTVVWTLQAFKIKENAKK